ncbi:MAG: gamma-glutamyl-gamma-aminobutyrate hydrolase family protein [Desulfomonile sp.]|nr:gamma-glutamyl-gamma-aminobutyrate hydrolase family protein [Desulfomonile sp.]
MRGLLVDLELEGPDPSRYARLREALTQRLPLEVDRLRTTRVTLEYIHFSAIERKDLAAADFVVLSPQGTPWYRYDSAGLEMVKEIVVNAAIADDLPLLGICGGHQFLALAFGGTVDFIDPTFVGKQPERYPKQAIGEHGVTVLHTLRDDPILNGVASHPGRFRAVESHYEEVKAVPGQFVNIAASALSEVQLMRIPDKLVYGVAFHPERCWDDGDCAEFAVPEGKQLLANFLAMVREHRR